MDVSWVRLLWISLEDTSKVHHHLGIIQRFFLWILLEFVIGGYFRGLSSLGDTSKVYHLGIRKCSSLGDT